MLLAGSADPGEPAAADEQALRAAVRSARPDDSRRVRLQATLAAHWRDTGRYREAGLLFRLTLPSAERLAGPDAPVVGRVCNEWGLWAKYTGRFDLAQRLYLRALAIFAAHAGPASEAVAGICHNLGGLAHVRGDALEGEEWARRSCEILAIRWGADHPVVAADRVAWAALLVDCGQTEFAEHVLFEALATLRAHRGPRGRDVAVALNNLAVIRARRGDLRTAEAQCRQALVMIDRLLGPGHPESAPFLLNLGRLRADAGDDAGAAAAYTRAIDALGPHVALEHPYLRAARAGIR
jgi:tetratricopeptide (TPR) repeat protein